MIYESFLYEVFSHYVIGNWKISLTGRISCLIVSTVVHSHIMDRTLKATRNFILILYSDRNNRLFEIRDKLTMLPFLNFLGSEQNFKGLGGPLQKTVHKCKIRYTHFQDNDLQKVGLLGFSQMTFGVFFIEI